MELVSQCKLPLCFISTFNTEPKGHFTWHFEYGLCHVVPGPQPATGGQVWGCPLVESCCCSQSFRFCSNSDLRLRVRDAQPHLLSVVYTQMILPVASHRQQATVSTGPSLPPSIWRDQDATLPSSHRSGPASKAAHLQTSPRSTLPVQLSPAFSPGKWGSNPTPWGGYKVPLRSIMCP